MFDVGMLEMLIILVVALLVLGPERLPKAAQQAGRWIGKAKRMMHHWSAEVDRQIENEDLAKQFKAQTRELDDEVSSLNDAIARSLKVDPPRPENTPTPLNQSSTEQQKLTGTA